MKRRNTERGGWASALGLPMTTILIVMIFLMAATLAHGSGGAWDQARVTEMAKRFERAVDLMFEALRVDEIDMDSPENYSLVVDLKSIRQSAISLTKRLSQGDGRAETKILFGQIELAVRRLRAEKTDNSLVADAVAEIGYARALLTQLQVFYTADPDLKH